MSLFPLVQSNPCFDCRCYPCRCNLPTFRREPCRCGGWIMAATGERSVIEAVQRHNATDQHERWAVARGFR